MNLLDFSIPAGWPGSTETWEYLQNMILQAQNTGLIGGKNWFVSGCEEVGGNVTNGLIVVDGEMLPFEGGPIQPKIIVVDQPVSRAFFGGAINPYYHNRKAVFGAGPGEVLYSDFKRNDPNNGVLARLDKVERMLKPLLGYVAGGVTVYGSWMFWGRPAAEIPSGWEAVPDPQWRGRIPMVLDPNQPAFNTVGNQGGAASIALGVANIPPHDHDTPHSSSTSPGGTGYIGGSGGAQDPTNKTGSTGTGQMFSILNPYKIVLFIRFVG